MTLLCGHEYMRKNRNCTVIAGFEVGIEIGYTPRESGTDTAAAITVATESSEPPSDYFIDTESNMVFFSTTGQIHENLLKEETLTGIARVSNAIL